MTLYHPEMHETPPAGAIIKTDHVINDTYSAEWSPDDEPRVLALFKTLRIRPRTIQTTEPHQTYSGIRKRWALITGAAHSKLAHRPDVAAERLLD